MDALIAKADTVLTGNIEDYPSGIILPVDKPWRWTSADVIRKLKWAASKHFSNKNLKVGHAGTLDPLATGVLLVCLGKATKIAEELQRHDKEYLAGINFGATTPSYDREKEIDARYSLDGVSRDSLERILPSFIGEQEQVAPLFSAKSVDGVRAYEMARKQYKAAKLNGSVFDHSEEELLSKQRIRITRMELVSYDTSSFNDSSEYSSGRPNPRINVINTASEGLIKAEILVECSKGTYIRALARDLGESLASGAFLDSLRRTSSGSFRVEDCLTIDEAMSLFLN